MDNRQKKIPLKNSDKYINYLKTSKRKSSSQKFKFPKIIHNLELKNLKFNTKEKILKFEKNVKEKHIYLKNRNLLNQKEYRKINDLYINLVDAKLKILQQSELYFN